MEVSFVEQAIILICAVSTGAIISIYFDIFRIIRIALPHHSLVVAIEDIIFSIGALFITVSFFSRYTDGKIRGYLLIGILLGFVVCHISIGALLMLQARLLIRLIKKILHPLVLIIIRICKFFKKTVFFLKKGFIFSLKQVIIIEKYCHIRKRGGKSGGKNKIKRHKPVR